MNISSTFLATVVVLFFLLPGFIFLRSFWGSDKGSLHNNNFYNYLIFGSFASTIIYFICIFIYNLLAMMVVGMTVKFEYRDAAICIPDLYETVADHKYLMVLNFYKILFISIIADLVGFFSGRKIRDHIITNELDITYPYLKFRNEWFYLLTGRDKRRDKKNYPLGLYVQVDVLCTVGNSVILYTGIVVDFKLKDESLEYIQLSNITRTGLTEWESAKFTPRTRPLPSATTAEIRAINLAPTFHELQSDFMILKECEIKNININYIKL